MAVLSGSPIQALILYSLQRLALSVAHLDVFELSCRAAHRLWCFSILYKVFYILSGCKMCFCFLAEACVNFNVSLFLT